MASRHHLVGAADTQEKELRMNPSKPVSAPSSTPVGPRVTPVTAAGLKQVVGGLRGALRPSCDLNSCRPSNP